MFKNVDSPLVVGCLRGLIVGLLVGIATFGTLYGAGAAKNILVSGIIAAVIPVWLGFLGWGQYDKARAAAAASGDPSAVHASDVKVPVSPIAPVAPVVNPTAVTDVSGTTTTPPATSTLSGQSRAFPEHKLNPPENNNTLR